MLETIVTSAMLVLFSFLSIYTYEYIKKKLKQTKELSEKQAEDKSIVKTIAKTSWSIKYNNLTITDSTLYKNAIYISDDKDAGIYYDKGEFLDPYTMHNKYKDCYEKFIKR